MLRVMTLATVISAGAILDVVLATAAVVVASYIVVAVAESVFGGSRGTTA